MLDASLSFVLLSDNWAPRADMFGNHPSIHFPFLNSPGVWIGLLNQVKVMQGGTRRVHAAPFCAAQPAEHPSRSVSMATAGHRSNKL